MTLAPLGHSYKRVTTTYFILASTMAAALLNKSFFDTRNNDKGIESAPPNHDSIRNKRMKREDLPSELWNFKEDIKNFHLSGQLKKWNSRLLPITSRIFNKPTAILKLLLHDCIFNRIIQLKKTYNLLNCSKKDRDYIIG